MHHQNLMYALLVRFGRLINVVVIALAVNVLRVLAAAFHLRDERFELLE